MDLSLDDFLYSGQYDETIAVPFEEADNATQPITSQSQRCDSTRSPEEFAATQDPVLASFHIDWLDPSLSFPEDTSTSTALVDTWSNLDLAFLDQPEDGILQEQNENQPFISSGVTSLDQFFSDHGAHLSPVPCTHCARLKMQCLVIKTTSVNPNPIAGCTSCASLFRYCSLAQNQKRRALGYETPLPVIGQLHGISEDGQSFAQDDSQQPSTTRATSGIGSRRVNTRSVKKTRVLKNWFACHLEHPYPSEDEKAMLAKQAGLSRTQVVNWFANNRRRHRVSSQAQAEKSNRFFPQGSPMPRSLLSDLSPIERWKNSPPEEEPASASAIHKALRSRSSSHSSLENLDMIQGDGADSSTSGDSFLYSNSVLRSGSSNSASSCNSYRSNDTPLHSRSRHGSRGEAHSSSWLKRSKSKSKSTVVHTFQCTFCSQSFKKKYDWIRHERSVHLPGLDSWICSIPLPPGQPFLVWRVGETDPQCIFCGDSSPTEEHIQSHEFETCADRPEAERTFTRKDHLWQHLHKFHQCRKWPGWTPKLDLLQHKNDIVRSVCGFCPKTMESWEERCLHVADHFKSGSTMAEWTGDCGINDQQPIL